MVISPWKVSKKFDKRFEERWRLIKPFVKRYGNPAIVHATKSARAFETILKEGKIKIPSEHGAPIKCPHLSKDLGIDDVVYCSLGFVYATSYDCKYNFLFDIKALKRLTYYTGGVSYLCYRNAVRYLYEHDRPSLERLAKQSAECRAVLDKFYNEPYKGIVLRQLDFWRIEEPLYQFLKKHRHAKKLTRIIRDTARELYLRYPASLRHAKAHYLTDATPEVLAKQSIDLRHNPYFVGIYLAGPIPKRLLSLLKKHYPDKYLFDGKRFVKIQKTISQ